MDYSKLTNEDLLALKQGDYMAMSDAGLQQLRQPAADEAPDAGFDAGEMAGNIPSSAYQYGMDMINAITNPMQTLTAVGGLVESGLERINPFMGEEDYQYQQYPEAVMGAMKERYGSGDAALNTLQTDPVGVLADVSGAVTGAGAATRMPALSKVGRAIDPLNIAINPLMAGGTAMIPKGKPAEMYESAVKFPPVSVKPEVRQRGVETALREKIMPTQAGIDDLSVKLEQFDSRIDELVKEADATGKTIPRTRIYSELSKLKRDLGKGARAPKNLAQSKRLVTDLENYLRESGKQDWKPSEMQDFKTKTYRDINWKAKPGSASETMKALARGARKSLAEMSPELAEVNRAYGPMAELRDILQQPAHRISNRNPMSIVPPLTATAGGAIGDVPGAIMGAGIGLMNNPQILARTALALRSAQDVGPVGQLSRGFPAAQALRQSALQSGRLEELMEEARRRANP